ncbi:MAG: hypothetical protein FJX40_16120 [Alphaproteobacteria bacterium]|nr:hypothetical protein [Alphaproteobacteria bacterium]
MARNNAMMVSKPSIDMADDGDGAWTTFSAAWPYDAVDYRRAAAKAEFERLSDRDRELAIRCAPLFIKAWRSAGRGALPSARKWLRERGWESVRAQSDLASPATPAERLPDGRWRLHPGSLQLQRWHEHERRTLGRARLGLTRPSEWPADVLSSACVGDRSRRRSARGDR